MQTPTITQLCKLPLQTHIKDLTQNTQCVCQTHTHTHTHTHTIYIYSKQSTHKKGTEFLQHTNYHEKCTVFQERKKWKGRYPVSVLAFCRFLSLSSFFTFCKCKESLELPSVKWQHAITVTGLPNTGTTHIIIIIIMPISSAKIFKKL